MKYLAIVQARYNSTRLRGKILMDLCGKPVLQHVIERVQKSKYVGEVIVVTGIGKENLPVLQLCSHLGVRVFAGSEDDVLDRFYQLAKLIQPEYIVRVTADCPCYDWSLLDIAIEQMEEDDYCWDARETLPDGMDLEIFRFSALKEAWESAELKSEREHVTPYIRKNSTKYKIREFSCPYGNYGNIRLTLDEHEDYTLINKVMTYFIEQGKEDYLLKDIIEYFENYPDDLLLNDKFSRNEGYKVSLLGDEKNRNKKQ